jgi:hypothetical protein
LEGQPAEVCVKPLLVTVVGVLLIVPRASAQVYWQPQPAPLVTAEHESWFQLGEAITYEGYFYYPAGARVFFNGNHMVRAGSYRGIPLYADTMIEPYSKVLVPVSGGQLQPYERRRTGDMAGTTGSQAPSFPVTMAGEITREPAALGTSGPMVVPSAAPEAAGGTGEAGAPVTMRPPRNVIEAGLKPKGLNEIFVNYAGYRWKAAGKAVPLDDQRFTRIGDYYGYPVYAVRGDDTEVRTIYLPSRAGLIAPYERAGRPVTY